MDSQNVFWGDEENFQRNILIEIDSIWLYIFHPFSTLIFLCCFSKLPSLCNLNPFLNLKRLPSKLLCSEKMFQPPVLNIAYSLQLIRLEAIYWNGKHILIWRLMKNMINQHMDRPHFVTFFSPNFVEIKTHIRFLLLVFVFHLLSNRASGKRFTKEANFPRILLFLS